ncbi:MAG: glycoside hydrolase family 38 C-terminal domain-containing protein [Anaerolineae bacterium]
MSKVISRNDSPTQPFRPRGKPDLLVLHAVAHLYWEREWHESFEVRRAQLLNTLSGLHEQMAGLGRSAGLPLRSFLLTGQTVILEDIATVRPDLVAMLVIYNAGGRLGLGPWYVLVDEALVSGEALIRNLLTARADATRYGLKLMPIAYVPDLDGYTAQLPQILNHFGIDCAFLHFSTTSQPPQRWQAPDGSSVLMMSYGGSRSTTPTTLEDLIADIREQQSTRPGGPFLWMYDSVYTDLPLHEAIREMEPYVSFPVQESDLPTFMTALRTEMPDNLRSVNYGELRQYSDHTGRFSSRIYLKQANAEMQSYLLRMVEPWMAVALTHGQLRYTDNLRALLNYTWRLLLKNQSRNAIGGLGSDSVHEENEIHYRRIADTGKHIMAEALAGLTGKPHRDNQLPTEAARPTDSTYIVVWNALNWPVQQVVRLKLDLPEGKYPARLVSPDGEEMTFAWAKTGQGGTISLLAQVPAVGYAAYMLELSTTPPPEHNTVRFTAGDVIANTDGETISVRDGKLVWRRKEGRKVIDNLLRFFDGGDAGDAYAYYPPEQDMMIRANLIEDTHIETSPLYERLVIRHRMRVASALRRDRGRDRGLKLVELRTTITFYDHVPGAFFRTTFANMAKDHRLRVHLRTMNRTGTILADSAFHLTPRSVLNDAGRTTPRPMQGVVGVPGQDEILGIITRGLPEYEAMPEDDQLTVALTLVRAVGWLSRPDIPGREGAPAPEIQTPGAQCQRSISAEYGMVFVPNDDPSALLRAREEFNAPLQAYQYDAPPEKPQRSYLSVVSDFGLGDQSDGFGAILTAFKPPEKGRGWILRFMNPHDRPVEVFITPFKRPDTVQIVTMAEELLSYVETDANGRALIRFNPHEVVTLRFNF